MSTEALKQALQMALEDLTEATSFTSKKSRDRQAKTLAALRTALTQATVSEQGEPTCVVRMIHDGEDWVRWSDYCAMRDAFTAQPAPAARPMPDVLFDGFEVLKALDPKAQARTSAENVSDVLDAVVKLIRSQPTAPAVPERLRLAFEQRGFAVPPNLDEAIKSAANIMCEDGLIIRHMKGKAAPAVPADRDVFVVNLMRHTTLTKAQARALIAHWLDGVEPDAELFAAAAVPAVPEGWKLARNVDGIEISSPTVGSVIVWPRARGDRRIPEEVLYALAEALLASAPTSTKGGV